AVGASSGRLTNACGESSSVVCCSDLGGGNVGRRVGLGQVAGVGRQDRGVVGAEDVDGHRGVGAVRAHHVERIGVGRPGDELVVRRARRVGPGAGAVDGEGAVGAGRAGLGNEGRRAVDVADGQRAGGGNVGGRKSTRLISSHGLQEYGVVGVKEDDSQGGADGVIAADDVALHRLLYVVRAYHVERRDVGPLPTRRSSGLARRVGPGAGAVDGEGAVGAGRAGLGNEGRRAVDVADGQRAGGGNV